MHSVEFQVVVDCAVERIFSIYSDLDWWRHRKMFSDIRWMQGEPWKEGSRMRIETRTPIRTAIDQVVLEFQPNQSVVYISHVLGITSESRIQFIPVSAIRTVIKVKLQMVGTVSRVLGFAVEPTIERAAKDFFDELRRDAETIAGA